MHKYPKKKSAVNTVNLALRVDPALRDEFKELRATVEEDVSEAIRIELRQLAKRLREKYSKQAS